MSRPVQPSDLGLYRMLSEPSFSPDGKRVAFSTRRANVEDDGYDSDVCVVQLTGIKLTKYTSGKKDSDPMWSPDGKSILFTSKRGFAKDEKGGALYVISAEGGEARLLVKSKEGVESPQWSPDSKTIYYLSNVVKEQKDDVKVIRRFGYWFNGLGFTYNKRKHLFKLDLSNGASTRLTNGEFDVAALAVSHSGRWIGYLAATNDLKPYISDLFLLDVRKGRRVKLTSSTMEMTALAWSPDDSQIAILGDDLPAGFASHEKIWVLNPRSRSLRMVDKDDTNKANRLNTDVRAKSHGPHTIVWDADGIYHLRAAGGSVELCRLQPGKGSNVVVGGRRSIEGYDVKHGKVVFVAMDSSHPEELYLKSKRDERLTDLNAEVYDRLDVLSPRPFRFSASDGERIEGWVLLPKSGRRVPGILYVHGGPKTAFGHSYLHEFQAFAGAGYAVIYINPRGSDGYSERFADIRGRYGTRDYDDLMEGLDFALRKFRQIDGRRLAVAGGSYGGYMANWVVGHTDRFKAAVADRSIASWISMWTTSDIGPHFTSDQMGGDPWNAEDKLMSDSPLRYAPNVKTPVLIVHSMEDYRCPMPEGIQFFTALKMLRKEAEMVLFPGENHDLSRVGKPKHRVARLQHYIRWFNRHLKS
ncbi:MAG: S9 family peptidase [Nitrososphaerales archaeon]|nr:S9 family peptidase [Nitrososphaerales archaeon]